MKIKRNAVSFALAVFLVLFMAIPTRAQETGYAEPTEVQLRWESMAFISHSVTKSGNGVNCYYVVQAYPSVTKIIASSTLYELKNGSYQYVDSWSNTYNDWYGYYSGYRATSGGTCKLVTTFKTYVGSTLKETIPQTSYT